MTYVTVKGIPFCRFLCQNGGMKLTVTWNPSGVSEPLPEDCADCNRPMMTAWKGKDGAYRCTVCHK